MTRPQIVVIGAGVAGLAAAHRLVTTSDAAVTVLETADRVGGVALTEQRDDTLVEWGPEAVPPTPEVVATLDELGLQTIPGAAPGGSLLWLDGRLRPLPVQLSQGAVPSPVDALALVRHGVLPPSALLRMAAEPLMARRRRPDGSGAATLADTYQHLLGPTATRRLIAPFAEGVFGAPADVLADTVVPRPVDGSLVLASLRRSLRGLRPPHRPQRRSASARPPARPAAGGLVAISGGMGRLVETLSEPLDVTLRAQVLGIDRRADGTITVRSEQGTFEVDALVLAVPAPVAGRLLQDVAPAAASALAQVTYGTSAVVHVEVVPERRDRLVELAASGWLGAPEERPAVAAASFVGLKWPHLRCPGRLRASVRRADLLAADDDRLLQAALDEMERVLGVPLLREQARLHRWTRALPVRTPDAAAQVAHAKGALPGNVVLVGTAEAGSGVASALASGRRGAEAVMAATDGSGVHLGGLPPLRLRSE